MYHILGVLDVYGHDDLYVIPSLGTGGAKLFESSIGMYLDSEYLLTIRNNSATKTLTALRQQKIMQIFWHQKN